MRMFFELSEAVGFSGYKLLIFLTTGLGVDLVSIHSLFCTFPPHIIMSDRGVVLSSVKARMQSLRDELDNLRDDYDLKCKECERLGDEKNQVIGH